MRTFKASNYDNRNFDNDDTFTFSLPKPRSRDIPRTGYILDCEEDGLFLMQKSACLKQHYTERDIAERNKLNAMTPIKNGDIVLVNGKQYEVKILGDYSDAGRLIPVSN